MASQELHLLRLAGKSVIQSFRSSHIAVREAASIQELSLTRRSTFTAGLLPPSNGTALTSRPLALSCMHTAASSLAFRPTSILWQDVGSLTQSGAHMRFAHTETGTDQQSSGTESADHAPPRQRRLERRPHWTSTLTAEEKSDALLERLAELDIIIDYDLIPGEWSKNMLCPQCEGGDKGEKSFVIKVAEDCESVFYKCYRANKCNWKGSVQL